MSLNSMRIEAKRIKDNMPLNVLLDDGCDFDFLNEFFKMHPNYDEKYSNGCIAFIKRNVPQWGKDNYCLHLIDNEFREVAISVNFSKSDNYMNNVLKAFRTAIHPSIKEFKKTFVPNESKCAISGKVLTDIYNVDVDHTNLDFIEIVDLFMKNRSYKELSQYLLKKESMYYFYNSKIAEDFIKLHNENTTLQFVDRSIHRNKPTKRSLNDTTK